MPLSRKALKTRTINLRLFSPPPIVHHTKALDTLMVQSNKTPVVYEKELSDLDDFSDDEKMIPLEKHYVGFDNPTLLPFDEDKDVDLYSLGITSCNLLVLTSQKGTYMAHINSLYLTNADNWNDIVNLTHKTIQAFVEKLKENPANICAYLITGENSRCLSRVIFEILKNERYDLKNVETLTNTPEFKIRVGEVYGHSLDFTGLSATPHPNCLKRNLIKDDLNLQWEMILSSLQRDHQATTYNPKNLPISRNNPPNSKKTSTPSSEHSSSTILNLSRINSHNHNRNLVVAHSQKKMARK